MEHGLRWTTQYRFDDRVTRRLMLLTIVLTCAAATIDQWSPLASAAEPAQRAARLGLVAPESPSTNPTFASAFSGTPA